MRSLLVAVALLLSAPLQQIVDRIATKKEWLTTAKACPAALMATTLSH